MTDVYDREHATGCALQFEPGRQRVRFTPLAGGQIADDPGHWMAIGGVSGIDRSFALDLIVKDDLVDACIDNRRTIIARNRAKLTGDRLFLFVNRGKVTFEGILIRPLLEE